MALTRDQKETVLEDFHATLDENSTVTFVQFDSISVGRMEQLRTQLREMGVSFQVAKKTLFGVALDSADIPGDKPEMPGQLAIAYGGDVTASARGVYTFETDEEAGEKIEIVGGIFDDEYQGKERMNEIAQIPGLEELRGMFVNAISSPISGFAVTLNERAKQLE